MSESFVQSSYKLEDSTFEVPLRPQKITDFMGQKKIQERLNIFLGAAKQRNEAINHTLFSGPPGLGKTTLAHIISKTMGTNITVTSGPVLEKPTDLAGVLTNLNDKDILFIDEIHRLPRSIEEYLYPAMEDFVLDLLIDSGPNARSVQIKLNKFTLIGATTRAGLLSSPLRSRFLFHARLDFYEPEILAKIISRSSSILKIPATDDAAILIAQSSRGTPRIANNLLRWIRDFAQMNQLKIIDKVTAKKALEMLSIDNQGLDEIDKKILSIIIDNYNGGPVGLQTLSVALNEETSTLIEIYEPYLVMKGFLNLTKRGREATKLAYEHLNKSYKNNGENL